MRWDIPRICVDDLRETNRLYAMSANGPYLHAFLNGLVLDLAKRLVKLSRNVSLSEIAFRRTR